MEDVIKKLIEVDKAARKKVSKAKKASLDSGSNLEEKKRILQEENEKKFRSALEDIKSSQNSIVEEKKKEIEEYIVSAMKTLEEKAEKNKKDWADEIYKKIIE